jgi:hypothetical protein
MPVALPDCRLRRREFADLDRQGHTGPDGLTAIRAASMRRSRRRTTAVSGLICAFPPFRFFKAAARPPLLRWRRLPELNAAILLH